MREVEMIYRVGKKFGCYHWVYIYLHFTKEDVVDKREYQVGVDLDPAKEEIKDVLLDDERELHWRMFF